MEPVFNNVFEKVAAANQRAMESALQLNQIAVRTQGLLARQQLAAFENCLEAATKQLKAASPKLQVTN